MGNRANVEVVESGVNIYTHWGGAELPFRVQDALAKRWRWDDAPYLTRIIYDEVAKGFHGTETGYGLSTTRPDNEHLIILVSTEHQKVEFVTEDGRIEHSWTFDEYAMTDPGELAYFWDEEGN